MEGPRLTKPGMNAGACFFLPMFAVAVGLMLGSGMVTKVGKDGTEELSYKRPSTPALVRSSTESPAAILLSLVARLPGGLYEGAGYTFPRGAAASKPAMRSRLRKAHTQTGTSRLVIVDLCLIFLRGQVQQIAPLSMRGRCVRGETKSGIALSLLGFSVHLP